jgi:hypothetical protein
MGKTYRKGGREADYSTKLNRLKKLESNRGRKQSVKELSYADMCENAGETVHQRIHSKGF